MSHRWLAAAAAVGALGALGAVAACDARDTVAVGLCAEGAECGTRAAYCAGEAPVLTADGARCVADVAAEAFSSALCMCRDLTGNDRLGVDSFDSREGPYVAPGDPVGAAVGIVGKIQTTGALSVRGDLRVSSGEGVAVGPVLSVGGDLACAGPLDARAGNVEIGGDAAVGGDLTAIDLSVGGTLTLPAGASEDVAGIRDVGATETGPVTVGAPCGCGVGDLIDVAAIVDLHANANDNAAAGFDPVVLEDVGDAGLAFAAPCGRLYASRLQGGGDVRLQVDGRTALFIGGNITLDGDLVIEVGPDGELDLFVAGNINIAGTIEIGDPERPSAVRFYSGGVGAINASARLSFAANLYAPLADFVVSAGGELFGAAFVSVLLASAPVDLHYDRAIADVATCAR